MFSSFFSLRAASKIIASAPCALSLHFQIVYNSLSSTLIYATSISKCNANSSKKFQTATLNQSLHSSGETKAGTRAFSVAARTVWNSLPASVKSEGNIVTFGQYRNLKLVLLIFSILYSTMEVTFNVLAFFSP